MTPMYINENEPISSNISHAMKIKVGISMAPKSVRIVKISLIVKDLMPKEGISTCRVSRINRGKVHVLTYS